jgi:hypothetical protein
MSVVYSQSFEMLERIVVLDLTSCHRRRVVLSTIHVLDLYRVVNGKHRDTNGCIPLSDMPISKATSSELFDSIASTPPLANLPNQLPRPDDNCISEKVSSESSNVALSLLFDTKNCGIEEDFEQSAIVIDSCSLCGREKDGLDGRLRVLKEVTLLTVKFCVVCE